MTIGGRLAAPGPAVHAGDRAVRQRRFRPRGRRSLASYTTSASARRRTLLETGGVQRGHSARRMQHRRGRTVRSARDRVTGAWRNGRRGPRRRGLRRRTGRRLRRCLRHATDLLGLRQHGYRRHRQDLRERRQLREERRLGHLTDARLGYRSRTRRFKSITGYREIDWKVGIDLDGTARVDPGSDRPPGAGPVLAGVPAARQDVRRPAQLCLRPVLLHGRWLRPRLRAVRRVCSTSTTTRTTWIPSRMRLSCMPTSRSPTGSP